MTTLNVSLEPHLQRLLESVLPATPPELSDDLAPYVSKPVDSQVIPYEILQRVSKWSQTPEGTHALEQCSPALDPRSYGMVSLLAGVRTSPEKHFPPHVTRDPLEEQRRQVEERKAISLLVNAVFSVASTGIAAWWGSERAGLALEWVRTISALFAPSLCS